MSPRILILRAPGTNCDAETAFAFERAGGQPEILHVRRLLESPPSLPTIKFYAFLADSATATTSHQDEFSASNCSITWPMCWSEFKAAGKLILGICNGFQTLDQVRPAGR